MLFILAFGNVTIFSARFDQEVLQLLLGRLGLVTVQGLDTVDRDKQHSDAVVAQHDASVELGANTMNWLLGFNNSITF